MIIPTSDQRRRNGARRDEKTVEQVLATSGVDGELAKRSQPRRWEKKVREMRRDATLGFLRDLYMAPVLAAEWTVTSDNPKYKDAEDLIYRALIPHRRRFLRHAMRGLLDFGWQPFEKIFAYTREGFVTLKQLKPLLQDISILLVDEYGHLTHVRNQPVSIQTTAGVITNWDRIDLPLDRAMVVHRDVEGTNWYGEALMYRVERPYDSWLECDDAARRYDTKIAGAHWIVYYPMGTSYVNGVETDNYEVAKTILNALTSSGKVAVPQRLLQMVEDLNSIDDAKMAWKIELLSASGSSESSFVGRQRYLDTLKVRGFGLPERAVLEGQFGTKAEAEAHADFAIDSVEMGHQELLEQVNQQLTDHLLLINKGPDYVGHVEVEAAPLTDWKRAQLRNLYMQFLSTPEGMAEETDRVDWDAVREIIGIPIRSESDDPSAGSRGQSPVGELGEPSSDGSDNGPADMVVDEANS